MRNRRRVINIGLLVVLVIAAGVSIFAAIWGGRSASSGDAQGLKALANEAGR